MRRKNPLIRKRESLQRAIGAHLMLMSARGIMFGGGKTSSIISTSVQRVIAGAMKIQPWQDLLATSKRPRAKIICNRYVTSVN